jgi:MFS family permease
VFTAIILVTLGQMFIELAFMGGYIFSIFELAPKLAGTLTAVMNTFGLLAGLLSPALVSYLTPNGSREEWLLVFYFSAGLCAFGGVFYLIFGSSELQPWAAVTDQRTKGSSSPIDEKELKLLKIKLIGGESNINGEVVKA